MFGTGLILFYRTIQTQPILHDSARSGPKGRGESSSEWDHIAGGEEYTSLLCDPVQNGKVFRKDGAYISGLRADNHDQVHQMP
jgi:hypothetical protein